MPVTPARATRNPINAAPGPAAAGLAFSDRLAGPSVTVGSAVGCMQYICMMHASGMSRLVSFMRAFLSVLQKASVLKARLSIEIVVYHWMEYDDYCKSVHATRRQPFPQGSTNLEKQRHAL